MIGKGRLENLLRSKDGTSKLQLRSSQWVNRYARNLSLSARFEKLLTPIPDGRRDRPASSLIALSMRSTEDGGAKNQYLSTWPWRKNARRKELSATLAP